MYRIFVAILVARKGASSSCRIVISDIGEDKSLADDLNKEQGIVSSRVALLLRSAEIKPLFHRFVRKNIFPLLLERCADAVYGAGVYVRRCVRAPFTGRVWDVRTLFWYGRRLRGWGVHVDVCGRCFDTDGFR